ncbi:rab9 effector protein with kelch motifs-like isoform X2 [Oreochromis niloticus]|uniref:rab9 effector protein with kelch motifs-like isoform X2 n=1 Tax=Oreochromis niloticus TaxID=8128 RepID=UPI0009051CF1|nr:rab9 effector protein with kelch motifs-like isoform X2 [Oreochromis niloticus]
MAESEVLKARYEHCRFVTKSCLQSLWVFGGAQQTGDRNCIQNVQLADSNPRWNVVTNGTPPSLRTYHTTSACLGDRLFVFSCREIGSAPASYSKLHDFDKGSMKWEKVQAKGDIPPGVAAHSAVVLGKTIYMFGGMTADGTNVQI